MSEIRFPWEVSAPSSETEEGDRKEKEAPAAEKKRGRRTLHQAMPAADKGAKPDWLYHRLILTGPTAELEKFAIAARGPGIIPWQLDYEILEEDIFNLAVSQPPAERALTIEGCRILARQFRERVEARQARAVALVERRESGAALSYQETACPFDLQVLLPVPPNILELGPMAPTALAWLRNRWGTEDRLRKVAVVSNPGPGRRLPSTHSVAGYSFFTIDRPPAAAITAIAEAWPKLRLVLRHRPLSWDRGWMA